MRGARLSEFIRTHLEEILQSWTEHTAHQHANEHANGQANDHASGRLTPAQLQDCGRQLLLAIADDLEQPDGSLRRPSSGPATSPRIARGEDIVLSCREPGNANSPRGMHATDAVAHYGALRSMVLRLWAEGWAQEQAPQLSEIARFNHAVDQAILSSADILAHEQDHRVRLLDQLLSTIPDHACVLSLDGTILYANRAMADHFGLPGAALLGKRLSSLGTKTAHTVESEIAEVVRQRKPLRSELLTQLSYGERRYHEYILTPILDADGKLEAVTGTARDVTERKQLDEEVWRMANFDDLTLLPNRHLFRDRLAHEVRHSERTHAPVALFFIDLDHFKEVNDMLGHNAGDSLLAQAAERIRACTRQEDTVARLGGDEFTVILSDFRDVKAVEAIAEKILMRLAEPFHIGSEVVQISGSIGITLFPKDAVTPENLVRNADQAMYVAKNTGRSRLAFFSSDMQEEIASRLTLLSELRRALVQGELAVYYQPIVALRDGKIRKAEALVRWLHPRQGELLPGAFIEAAEESGLIAQLDNMVLEQAVACSCKWKALAEPSFQISVNKSALAFVGSGSHDWKLGRDRAPPDFPPGSISVEITEGVLLRSTPEVQDRLAALRERGVQIALDDFGTGYSAMSYLTRFSVDYLKIDQSFVRDLLNLQTSRAVAGAIITLAHSLGMQVIAEGVETAAQRDWLAEAGCDFAQGFLYSRALPAEQFAQLLHNGLPVH